MAAEAELKPSVEEVALIALRTRTVGFMPNASGLGGDTGPGDWTTFDDTTRPTSTEVERVIDAAYAATLGKVDMTAEQVTAAQAGAVKHAVALYAAVLIEVSFFRETINEALLTLWRQLADEALGAVGGGGEPGQLRRYSIGTLVIGTTVADDGYVNADFVPGIDDDDPYQQPLVVGLGSPPHNRGGA